MWYSIWFTIIHYEGYININVEYSTSLNALFALDTIFIDFFPIMDYLTPVLSGLASI